MAAQWPNAMSGLLNDEIRPRNRLKYAQTSLDLAINVRSHVNGGFGVYQ
jgi:hypothetical protein